MFRLGNLAITKGKKRIYPSIMGGENPLTARGGKGTVRKKKKKNTGEGGK